MATGYDRKMELRELKYNYENRLNEIISKIRNHKVYKLKSPDLPKLEKIIVRYVKDGVEYSSIPKSIAYFRPSIGGNPAEFLEFTKLLYKKWKYVYAIRRIDEELQSKESKKVKFDIQECKTDQCEYNSVCYDYVVPIILSKKEEETFILLPYHSKNTAILCSFNVLKVEGDVDHCDNVVRKMILLLYPEIDVDFYLSDGRNVISSFYDGKNSFRIYIGWIDKIDIHKNFWVNLKYILDYSRNIVDKLKYNYGIADIQEMFTPILNMTLKNVYSDALLSTDDYLNLYINYVYQLANILTDDKNDVLNKLELLRKNRTNIDIVPSLLSEIVRIFNYPHNVELLKKQINFSRSSTDAIVLRQLKKLNREYDLLKTPSFR